MWIIYLEVLVALAAAVLIVWWTWRRKMQRSVQDAGNGESELGNVRLEAGAVLGDHLVGALHRAHRRGYRRAAGVLEALTRLQQRLRADHAEPAHFLDDALGIGDDPVPADELRGDAPGVADGDGVGEDVAAGRLVGLVGEVLGRGAHRDVVVFLLRHALIVNCAPP